VVWPIPRKTVLRSCRIALIVGSLLALLNHGDKLFAWQIASLDWWKMVLTYLIPFSVSCYASLTNSNITEACEKLTAKIP